MRKSFVVLLFFASCNIGLAESVFDNLDATFAGGFWNDTDQVKTAQQFILGDNNTVSSVTLRLNRYGDPEGAINIEIWDDEFNAPGKLVGTVGSISAEDVIAGGEIDYTEHVFENPVSGLVPNERYHVVLSTAATDWDFTNNVEWGATGDAEGANGAGEAHGISLSLMDWHTVRDFPEGGPPFPAYFLTSIDAVNVVLGDFDSDNMISATDIDLLSSAIRSGTEDLSFDVNGDGQLNLTDHGHWVHDPKFAHTYFGDANLDGQFNSGDLTLVFQAAKYEVDEDAGWAEGDWTGDGGFDSTDLTVAFQDGGYELGPRILRNVPEPSGTSMVLLSMGMLTILTRCRIDSVPR